MAVGSFCLCLCLSLSLYLSLSVSFSLCLCLYLSDCLSVSLCLYVCVCVRVSLSLGLSNYLSQIILFSPQCVKCKEYFSGTPTNGHQCYRSMQCEEHYCFDPITQNECNQSPRPLLKGRTVFFVVQPRFLNVDIRVTIDVIAGSKMFVFFSCFLNRSFELLNG